VPPYYGNFATPTVFYRYTANNRHTPPFFFRLASQAPRRRF